MNDPNGLRALIAYGRGEGTAKSMIDESSLLERDKKTEKLTADRTDLHARNFYAIPREGGA